MIRSVFLRNLKGIKGEIQLTGKDILVGPNGSGKTAILEGIQLALTGYTALGKKPGALLALGGDVLEARVQDENAHFYGRIIEKTKTSASSSVVYDGAVIKDSDPVPESFNFPSEVIHPAEFLALSGEKRAAWLFEAMGKSFEGGVDTLTPDRVPGKWPWLSGPMPAGEILEKLTAEHTTAKKEADRCKANLQRLIGDEAQLPIGTQREWEEKLAKIDADLATAQKDQAKHEERARLDGSRHLLRKEAEENLRKADQKIQQTEELIARLSTLANGKKVDIPAPAAEIQAKIEARRQEKAVKGEKARELRAQAKMIESHGKCPTCGTAGNLLDSVLSDWDRKATALEMEAEEIDDELTALDRDLRDATQADQINRGIDQAVLSLKVEKDALVSYQKSRAKLEDDLVRLNQGTGSQEAGDPALVGAQVEGLISQQKAAREALKKHHESTSIKKSRVAAQEELQALQTKLEEIKKAGTRVKEIRNKILDGLTEGLMDPFTKAVETAFGTRPFFRLLDAKGKPEVDFGIIRNDREISFDTLSGGERLVILVALVAALQIAKGGKARLCMVEMAEADTTRMEAVIGACNNIGFEQVILATCHPLVSYPKGWNEINMADFGKEAQG